jgi:hypothetical protein
MVHDTGPGEGAAEVPVRYPPRVERAADIVVVSATTGRPELVVAVKLPRALDTLETATAQLRDYMKRAGVPLGLVIVGRTIRLLRDDFSRSEDGSIVVAWTLPTEGLAALAPPAERTPAAGFDYESRVQQWLESLATPGATAALPAALRGRIEAEVVPVVETGAVSAAGPRFVRRARTG